ncbi:MAG: Tetratricopeptide 2 repeat protein, partial [Bryobacterales bacterium]|nr:Tetratricopeptide 2 repeat protein [Bryobacterales bacterium]
AVALVPLTARDLKEAERLYSRTEYEASLKLLDKQSADGPTNFLLGRDHFMTGDFKAATESFQKATGADPKNGEYMDWLGRAYGKRAEMANPFQAPVFASKARQAFERSVELNPKDSDALSDLFDYYLDAPGFLGGGYDKAAAVAEKIAAFDPSEGYFEKAKLAQKRKEFDTAEQHLRQAIAATPGKIAGLLELARFLANQGRTHESDALLAQAQQIEPDAPRVLYTRADLLIKQKRDLPEARLLLKKYMASNLTVDDPPKTDAERLLKRVGGA